MGSANNTKYSRDELEKIVKRLGYIREEKKDNGDHRVFEHKIYKDLKVLITIRKDLSENEIKCASVVIIITMKVLDMDTSIFKGKDGVEGKLHNTAKRAEKNICALFDEHTRKCIGATDDEGVLAYIDKARRKIALRQSKVEL